jgi:hypothetical protein
MSKRKVKQARKAKRVTPPPEPEKSLVLRTVAADMVSRGTNADGSPRPDFTWPALGPVQCSDWEPTPACGHGLHGLLWGEGDWGLLAREADAKWQVVEVDTASVVKIDNGEKVKFPRGEVLYSGEQAIATTMVLCGRRAFERTMALAKHAGAKAGAEGDYSSATSSGDSSSAASSGNYSRAASSGYSSSAASSGDSSRAASSGDYSRAASSGDSSRAAQKGESGIACALGDDVTVTVGERGLLIATWWDEPAKRYRAVVGEVGVDGIEAGVAYVVRDGKLVRSTP